MKVFLDRLFWLLGFTLFLIVFLFALWPFAGALRMAPWMVR